MDENTARASYLGRLIAGAPHSQMVWVEGNGYFPPDSVNPNFLRPSATTSHCPWKGQARYDHVVVNGQVNQDAAWFYPEPLEEAAHIKNRIAFWRGVVVEEEK